MALWSVAAEGSFVVGRHETDIAAAQVAGISGYLFTGGDLLERVRGILQAGTKQAFRTPPAGGQSRKA